MKVSIVLFFLLTLSPHLVFAQDSFSREDLSIQERAKKRLYPGGADESGLKVTKDAAAAEPKLTRYQIEKEVYQRLFKEESNSKKEE